MNVRDAVDIEDDEPVTLSEACQLFFRGRLTPSALRREASRGNLDIMQIARKDFVTRRAIEEMKQLCLRRASRPDSGSEKNQSATEGKSNGSSWQPTPTESESKSAKDALRLRLKKPQKP
jgi:hypothetical protein